MTDATTITDTTEERRGRGKPRRQPLTPLALYITAAMDAKDMNGPQLATELGVSVQYANKIMRGAERPAASRIDQLATVLDLDAARLRELGQYDV